MTAVLQYTPVDVAARSACAPGEFFTAHVAKRTAGDRDVRENPRVGLRVSRRLSLSRRVPSDN
jgi:hypothetical protein